jgi:hypothetical protein
MQTRIGTPIRMFTFPTQALARSGSKGLSQPFGTPSDAAQCSKELHPRQHRNN